MRSARYVQEQIDITMLEIREKDSLIWVQFHLHDWHAFQPVPTGERKWILRQDTSDMTIPIEWFPKTAAMYAANESFQPVNTGRELGPAYHFYAGSYFLSDKMVRMYPNGTVYNLDTFVAYQPIIDYSTEPGKGDRILLKSTSGKWKKFGLYVDEERALEIYALKRNDFGRKMYRLIRIVEPIDID